MSALGTSLGMNKATVDKISTGLHVASSALSGAMAGMSFGPYGAVIGAVAGIIGGLFGSSSTPDPTLLELSQVSNQISTLQATLQTGLTTISKQISAVSDQITDEIAGLSDQISKSFSSLQTQVGALQVQVANLQSEMEENFKQVESQVRDLAKQGLWEKFAHFSILCTEYEQSYRGYVAGGGKPTSSKLTATLSVLLQTVNHPDTGLVGSTGFSQASFVGDQTLEEFLDSPPVNMSSYDISEIMFFADNLSFISYSYGGTSWSRPPNPTGYQSLSTICKGLARRLGNGWFSDGDDFGAAIVKGLEVQVCQALVGFANSPEAAYMDRDALHLVPKPDANPSAIAPQHLWDVAVNLQTSLAVLSDVTTLSELLKPVIGTIKDQVSFHSLMTAQQMLPALLYARRSLAQSLADSCYLVFSNPYMAGVDVYRRAFASIFSELGLGGYALPPLPGVASQGPAPVPWSGPYYSKFRLLNIKGAQWYMANPMNMPLLSVSETASKVAFSSTPNMNIINGAINKLFQTLANGNNGYSLALTQLRQDTYDIAPPLCAVVRALSGSSLSTALLDLRSKCIALGVIEDRIDAWLQGLRSSGVEVGDFDGWFDGFAEYGTIATLALAQPEVTDPNYDPDSNRALVIIRSYLDYVGSSVPPTWKPNADFPSNPQALPYPFTLGSFWGWGAEKCTPQEPTSIALLDSLMRPECSFVGANISMVGATGALSQMIADEQQYSSSGLLFQSLDRGQKFDVRAFLRGQLAG